MDTTIWDEVCTHADEFEDAMPACKEFNKGINYYNQHQLTDAYRAGAHRCAMAYDEKLTSITEKIFDKACELYSEKFLEFFPELIGYGGIAKHLENEFRNELVQVCQ